MNRAESLRSPEQPTQRRIGIDLDDSTFQFIQALIKYRNKVVPGSNLRYRSFHTMIFEDVWGGTIEETDKFMNGFYQTKEFAELALVPGADKGIRRLKKHNNDLSVITARQESLIDITSRTIERHFAGLFSDIYTADFYATLSDGSRRTKAHICKENKIDILIEDGTHHAIMCAESGIDVVLFDKPWNQGVMHPKITRVFGWRQATKYIDSLPPKNYEEN